MILLVIKYFFGVLLRTIWSPFHLLGYVLGYKPASYNYNYYSWADFTMIMKTAVKEGDVRLPTYEEYLAKAKQTLQGIYDSRSDCIVFHVDAKEMLAWMKENNLPNTLDNRTHYASYLRKLAKTHGVVVKKQVLPVFSGEYSNDGPALPQKTKRQRIKLDLSK